jgi:hypothetical protein
MLNANTIDRLINWKFRSAVSFAEQDAQTPENDLDLIRALAQTFENSGWFDGNLGEIVSAAVSTLVPEEAS